MSAPSRRAVLTAGAAAAALGAGGAAVALRGRYDVTGDPPEGGTWSEPDDAPGADAADAPPATGAGVAAGAPGRRGLWLAYGTTPSAASLAAAPARHGVVVLNLWETAALQRLKQRDPSIVVLAYQDLSSSRDYDPGPLPPAGIGWAQVQANPDWLARDTAGRQIGWDGYPGHWQTAVWDDAYQAAWTANVTARITAQPWDGVLADNDLASLHWYSDAVLAGTAGPDQTDQRLRAGLDRLVERAGRALADRGKLFVPNIAEARLHPGRWAAHARWGGGMDESFAHFGTSQDGDSFVTGDGPGGWLTQSAQAAGPGLMLAVTPAAPSGRRALRYGYASALVRGGVRTFWQPSARPDGGYVGPQSIPELAWSTGSPVEEGHRSGGGDVWVRRWQRVWAAVNPGDGPAAVVPPEGAVDAAGRRPRRVRLAAADGVVLRLR